MLMTLLAVAMTEKWPSTTLKQATIPKIERRSCSALALRLAKLAGLVHENSRPRLRRFLSGFSEHSRPVFPCRFC